MADNTFRWIKFKTQVAQNIVCVQLLFSWQTIRKFCTELESDIIVRSQDFLDEFWVEMKVIRERNIDIF